MNKFSAFNHFPLSSLQTARAAASEAGDDVSYHLFDAIISRALQVNHQHGIDGANVASISERVRARLEHVE